MKILDHAVEQMARRFVNGAMWDSGACTWEIVVPDRSASTRASMRVVAGADLYHGSTGIALFLAELCGLNTDRNLLPVIRGAFVHAARESEAKKISGVGLYSGISGLAYAAARVFCLTGDSWYAEQANRYVAAFASAQLGENEFDVIDGAAGGIVACLEVARLLNSAEAVEVAIRLGMHLRNASNVCVDGWSWGGRYGTSKQDLCGYAHGSSGPAHAFLELFSKTGEGSWLRAAKRTISYERQHVDHQGDWPDFRCPELTELLMKPEGHIELRSQLLRGDNLIRWNTPSMRAWCHGSPGIGLVRVRAETLGVANELDVLERQVALMATSDSLNSKGMSYSLCHGLFGNAETLLIAEEKLNQGGCPTNVMDLACEAVERYEGRSIPWPSGALFGEPEPSLMLGDAGIGHFLLRVSGHSVPSVLLVSGWGTPSTPVLARLESCPGELGKLFPHTVRLLARTSGNTTRLADLCSATVIDPDSPRKSVESFCVAMASQTPASPIVAEAIRLDIELMGAIDDFDDYLPQFFLEFGASDPTTIDFDEALFLRRESVRLIATQWSWQEDNPGKPPEERASYLVIYRRGRRVLSRSVSAAHGFILEILERPHSLQEVCAGFAERTDGVAFETIVDFIRRALTMFISGGVIETISNGTGNVN